MATVAARGSRKTQVKEPKPNGRGGQINAPPQLIEKTCPMCEAKFSLWLAPGEPGRNLCFECDPEPGGRAMNGELDGKSKLTSNSAAAAAAMKNVDGSAAKALIEIIVDVRKIEVREQARKAFDEEKIAALAESIEREGLLQPPVVRHNSGNAAQPYRLVAGERRLRAVKKLGWSSIPARLASAVDDDQALLAQGFENVLREQFNDVELAEWCKLATSPAAEGGGGLTQDALAKRLGVTQAEISNRIRLLRAPKWALEMVISGQMSRKHATELLAFEGCDAILAAVEKMVAKDLKAGEELGTAISFGRDVHRKAFELTAPIARERHDYRLGRSVKFAIDDEERAKLKTVTVRIWGEGEERALDKKAAEKLLAAAETAAIAKAEAKAKNKGKKTGTEPAEQKLRDEQLAQQYKRRVEEWFHDWLRVLCADAIKRFDGTSPAYWLMLWTLLEQPVDEQEVYDLFLAGVLPECERARAHKTGVTLEIVAGLNDGQLRAGFETLAIGLLIDDDGEPRGGHGSFHGAPMPVDTLEALTRLLKLDVAAAWRDDRRSTMRRKFWELHSKDQLLELGQELKVPLLDSQKKSVMVNLLVGQEKPLALPKALAGLVGKIGAKKAERKRTRSRGGAE